MKKISTNGLVIAALAFLLLNFTSCGSDDNEITTDDDTAVVDDDTVTDDDTTDDDDVVVDDMKSDYTLWMQLGNWPNTTQYVIGTDDLSTGSVDFDGAGAEVTSVADYGIVAKDGFFYYPSTSSDFGKLSKFEFKDGLFNLVSEVPYTFQTSIGYKGWINDNTLAFIGGNGDWDKILYTLVDTETLNLTNGEFDLPAIPDGYEYIDEGYVSYVAGRILLEFRYSGDQGEFSDNYVAEISYPAMETLNVFTDTRGYYGRCSSDMWRNGSGIDESENVYSIHFAGWLEFNNESGDYSSYLLKINSGENEYDQSYAWDLSAELGGGTVNSFFYIENGIGIVKYEDATEKAAIEDDYYQQFALINVETQTLIKKLDIPFTKGNTVEHMAVKDGQVFVAAEVREGDDLVYEVNTSSGEVTAGLSFSGGYSYFLRLDILK